MSIEFSRKARPMRDLPLAAMIDVVFILMFFFMLTTSFLRIESMELMLPSAGEKAGVSHKSSTIILRGEEVIQFGQRIVSLDELKTTLATILAAEPGHGLLILVDNEVSMQRMVTVMDVVSLLGSKGVSVRPLPPTAVRGQH